MAKGIYINDSIHGLIRLSEYEKRIISSAGFNRLHDVYQNSTVYLTFPSNRTKRFEHSIGTMNVCSDMFYYSILNATEENVTSFFEIFKQEFDGIIQNIREKISDYEYWLIGRNQLNNLKKMSCDDFQLSSLIPNNILRIENKEIQIYYVILLQAIRAAALLHDIGHPPFSHVVERAMRKSYNLSKEKDSKLWKNYRERMDIYFGEKKRDLHEVMGDEITKSIFKSIVPKNRNKKDVKNLFEVMVMECVLRIFSDNGHFAELHRIIDSSLDGDRLDYVTRDTLNSGLNAGSIDYSRIFLDMQMNIVESKILFCVPVKAINAVEDFLKRRFNLYKNIINHHRVIKTDYLLEHTVENLIVEYMEQEDEENINEDGAISFDISGLWFPLGNRTAEEKANELSQWNDSWLMTVLKKIYNSRYYLQDFQDGSREDIIEKQLAELLRNEKQYYSVIKRSEDFAPVDEGIKEEIIKEKDSIEEIIQTLVGISENYFEKENKVVDNNSAVVDVNPEFRTISRIIEHAQMKQGGFMLYIWKLRSGLGMGELEDEFYANIRSIVKEKCNNIFLEKNVYDVIVEFKKISSGLERDKINFYSEDNQCYYSLEQLSGVADSLEKEREFLPFFYVYLLVKDDDFGIKAKKKDLLLQIGREIGKLVVSQIKKILDSHIRETENEC